jgi:hypothetical protein
MQQDYDILWGDAVYFGTEEGVTSHKVVILIRSQWPQASKPTISAERENTDFRGGIKACTDTSEAVLPLFLGQTVFSNPKQTILDTVNHLF